MHIDEQTTNSRAEDARNVVAWFHSLKLAPGVVTPGAKSVAQLEHEWNALRLPDLRGKSVLDMAAFDGYFSFAAERAGALRVVALDSYAWSVDWRAYSTDRVADIEAGVRPPLPRESRHWHPAELPGRRGFDAAREILGSRVEPVVGDYLTMDLSELGRFDVVLYLGVLYHMEDPLGAMRRVFEVTAPGGLAVVESQATEFAGLYDTPLCEFYPADELGNDPTNWWAPNAKGLEGICHAAGFGQVEILTDQHIPPPRRPRPRAALRMLLGIERPPAPLRTLLGIERPPDPVRYRVFAHARR
jgi:tRNA (mo5U34)-methyltransferase